MPHDIFICHSAKDKPTADALCATLEAKGLRCWIAPRDVLPGADWSEAIIDAINGSRALVLVYSEHANTSRRSGVKSNAPSTKAWLSSRCASKTCRCRKRWNISSALRTGSTR